MVLTSFFAGSDAFLYISFLFIIAKLVVGIFLWTGIEKVSRLSSRVRNRLSKLFSAVVYNLLVLVRVRT